MVILYDIIIYKNNCIKVKKFSMKTMMPMMVIMTLYCT